MWFVLLQKTIQLKKSLKFRLEEERFFYVIYSTEKI
jgi:hypothetical protein